MPLFTTSISNQLSAATSGKLYYPALFSGSINNVLGDLFNREDLTQSGNWVLYTSVANAGTGTSTLNGNILTAASGAVTNDDVDLRTSGFSFDRTTSFASIDNRSQVVFYLPFKSTSTTDVKGFVGLVISTTTSISAIPTTGVHAGIYWDTSVDTNYYLTSGNGSAQVKTSCATALANSTRLLKITWTGLNSLVLEFYDTDFTTLLKSQTVTAFGANGVKLHWYVQNIALAAASLTATEWEAIYS